MSDATNNLTGVRWSLLHGTHQCEECRTIILPGQRMATWDDVTVDHTLATSRLCHKLRRFCGNCGELLEDSLTTTEMIR